MGYTGVREKKWPDDMAEARGKKKERKKATCFLVVNDRIYNSVGRK